MTECSDRDCRDGIYGAISKLKDAVNAEFLTIRNLIDEKMSVKTMVGAMSTVVGFVGVLLTLAYLANASSQSTQNENMTKNTASIAQNSIELHQLDKAQGQLTTQMEAYQQSQKRLERKVDANQRLLIRIGAKMGIEPKDEGSDGSGP